MYTFDDAKMHHIKMIYSSQIMGVNSSYSSSTNAYGFYENVRLLDYFKYGQCRNSLSDETVVHNFCDSR